MVSRLKLGKQVALIFRPKRTKRRQYRQGKGDGAKLVTGQRRKPAVGKGTLIGIMGSLPP